MGERSFAPVAWYCVRVDHVVRPRKIPPVLTVRERSWAYCRSGASDEDHYWAATHGVPLYDLYRDPTRRAARSKLDWVDNLRDELRETLSFSSCVFEIARKPRPLRISFDEPGARERALAATVTVELADAHGSVGQVTLFDGAREGFTDQEIELLRVVVAPYAIAIREWLRDPAGKI